MPDSATILLVDDEDAVQKPLTYPLERDGYRVVPAWDGEEALEQFERERVDLVVLDIMLPKFDGLEVCKRLRATSQVPIIMLTARDDELDSCPRLELGADDYITKPFSIREFRSRVRALLRRAAVVPHAELETETISANGLVVDLGRRTVEVDGEAIQLTYVEFEILRMMMARPGRCSAGTCCSSSSGVMPATAIPERSTSTSATCERSWKPTRGIPSSSRRCAGSATASASDEEPVPQRRRAPLDRALACRRGRVADRVLHGRSVASGSARRHEPSSSKPPLPACDRSTRRRRRPASSPTPRTRRSMPRW